MNKSETVKAVSQATAIEFEKCTGIVDALEAMFTHELERSGGMRNFFDGISLLLGFLKNEQHSNAGNGTADLVEKVAYYSETSVDESQKVFDALVDILNKRIKTSRSAKRKYKIATKLVNIFKHQ